MNNNIIKGTLVDIDMTPFLEHTLAENISFFWAMTQVYQKIMIYKKGLLYSDNVDELIPLAITDSLLSIDEKNEYEQKMRIAFCFALMCKLTISYRRKEIKKVMIKNPEAMGVFTYKEILEILCMIFNHHRGNDETLTMLMPALKRNFDNMEELIAQYIRINPKGEESFETLMLKFGYSKK